MIFPLPYSSYINTSREPTLSQHSTLALLATLEYLKRPTRSVIPSASWRTESRLLIRPDIVIIAEQTFGSRINKTAHLMQQFLVEGKIDIQNIKIIDRVANNTYEQLEALKQIAGNNTITLITFTFHATRIKVIAHHLKLNVQVLTVEELLKDNAELSHKITQINSLPKMQKVFRIEKLFVGLAKLDKFGLIPKTYSHLFGPRAPLA